MGAGQMTIGPVWLGPGRPNVCFWHFSDIPLHRRMSAIGGIVLQNDFEFSATQF